MQNKNPPMKFLNKLNEWWNFLLFVFSVSWAISWRLVVSKAMWEEGFFTLICDPKHHFWEGKNLFLLWAFIMSKVVELGDTLWLALRKRPIIFLHWYHHTTVLLFCWHSLGTHYTVATSFGLMNSIIHSFMYYYYWRAAQGVRMTWGHKLTIAQTLQMFIGMLVTIIWTYVYYFTLSDQSLCLTYDPSLNLLTAVVMYGSYFFLFLKFYFSKTTTNKKGE